MVIPVIPYSIEQGLGPFAPCAIAHVDEVTHCGGVYVLDDVLVL